MPFGNDEYYERKIDDLEQYFRDRAEKYRTVYNNCWGWREIAEEYDKAANELNQRH